MATVQIPLSVALASAADVPRVHPLVETRQTWGGEWVVQDYLHPVQAVDVAQPGMPKAYFRWRYGQVAHEDRAEFCEELPLELANHFVRVSLVSAYDSDPVPIWHGILGDVPYEPYGVTSDDGEDARGWQTLLAWGIEHCLDGVRCTTAQIHNGWAESQIGWLPCFNMRYRRGGYVLGNRSSDKMSGGYYAFGEKEKWTSHNIAEALLKWFGPDLGDGTNWSLAGQTGILEHAVEQWRFEGQTLRGALNMLIDRRRGQGWTVRVDGDAVCIWVFTHFDTPISVCGVTLPANTEQAALVLDDETGEIGEAVVVRELSQRVHKIEVLGERIVSGFTVSYGSSTLEAGWSAAEEAAWKASAGDIEGNDRFGARLRFARVGCYHRVPNAWDWYGLGGGNAAPKAKDDGTVDGSEQAAYWRWAKHFEPLVPIVDAGGGVAEPRYRRPLVWVSHPQQDGKYIRIDHPPADPEALEGYPAVAVKLVEHELAFYLRANPMVMMAGAAGLPVMMEPPTYEYDSIVATMAVRLDERIRVVVEVAPDDDDGPERVVTIYARGAEYWWVTPGTIDEINADGTLHVYDGANPVRDDTWTMLIVAAMAKAWYGRERRAVTVTWNYPTPGVRVGTMLEAVWNQQVMSPGMSMGTVVSEQVWNFGKRMRTRAKTAFAELDWSG